LSVFNIGVEYTPQTWRSLLRQLIVQGYLRVDHEGFGALRLTEVSRVLLRGETNLRVREDAKDLAPRKKPRGERRDVRPEDAAIWDALRECRRRLAAEYNLPPYVIFHDATLLQMLTERPADPAALLRINGVGQAKLERYGEHFLEVLRREG
jgi:ATP-dependent DNA helicase RecQ